MPAVPRDSSVFATTGHTIVAADVAPDWLAKHLPPGDPGAAFLPPFLGALEAETGRWASNIDVVTLAPRRPGPPALAFTKITDQNHPRVRRALHHRDDVTIWSCDGGVMAIGRGLGGRWEVGLEVAPDFRGRGLGRAMAADATRLVPEDRPLWAQIAPGNAASLRAFLAVGFRPVGQETLLVTSRMP
jgi:RimJ/RimL family protein N-acetyltransferase